MSTDPIMKYNNKAKKQKGVSMTETMMVMPIILVLGLGTVELGYIWQAKSALDYAALMAARAGAMSNLDPVQMRCAALKAMFATRVQVNKTAEDQCTVETQVPATPNKNLILYVSNPTYEAFQDYGIFNASSCSGKNPTNCEIPNSSLSYRSTAIASASNVNIQDANIVRVQLVYGYDPLTPFIRNILLTDSMECIIFKVACNTMGTGAVTPDLIKGSFVHPFVNRATDEKRLPLLGYATVRAETTLKATAPLLNEANRISYGQILSRCQVVNLIQGRGVGGIPPDRASATTNCN